MKTLYIIRHAKSSWSQPFLDDFDRGLNKRGKDDIVFMSKWLNQRVKKVDLVLSSPAKRAKKTLKAIKRELDINEKIIKIDDSIYEATLDDLLDILISLDDTKETLFLIGHNPSLNEMANFLSDKVIDNIPTSGIVEITFDIKSWSEIRDKKGKITAFEYPKKLKAVK